MLRLMSMHSCTVLFLVLVVNSSQFLCTLASTEGFGPTTDPRQTHLSPLWYSCQNSECPGLWCAMVDNGIHSVSLGLLLCTWNVVTSSFCADITDLNHTPKSPMFHLSQRKGSGDNEPKFLGLGLRATNEITSVIYWTSKKK